MLHKPEDICPRPERLAVGPTDPLSPPIHLSTVYRCADPDQALKLLRGEEPGYVYQRDAHPNADMLAEKCRQLHGAERAAVTSSGMAAMALAVLSQLENGDHIVVSDQLYGRSGELLSRETTRLGIASTLIDVCDLAAVEAAMQETTKLVVIETITNPLLRVADIRAVAEIAHARGAKLLVDNTFASPLVCRPLELGADLVLESISKIIGGHSDVMLGLLCGGEQHWQRVAPAKSIWGLASSPFDCWLALRGLATLHLRIARACENAVHAAKMLANHPQVARVYYPGREEHPDYSVAATQFTEGFGWMVTFDLAGGLPAAEALITAAKQIPFCPSLGEVSTTLTHPASTSHRQLSPEQQAELGITVGTIRLSVGTESSDFVCEALAEALRAIL